MFVVPINCIVWELVLKTEFGQAYYEVNAHRKNLIVLTNSTVSRVLFEPGSSPLKATGVEFLNGGKTYVATTKGEVILAAGKLERCRPSSISMLKEFSGAFQSPQILELSGQQDMIMIKQEHSRAPCQALGTRIS